MTRVVCDTGPLLHLTEAHALDTLHLVGQVYTPPQVISEMNHLIPDWQTPTWITLDSLEQTYSAEAAAWLQAELLHAGEAEAIALARQIGADWLLTDDAAARLFASGPGLEVHGSLGIILWAAAIGHFNRVEAETALARLATSTLWLSNRILDEARATLKQIYQTEPLE